MAKPKPNYGEQPHQRPWEAPRSGQPYGLHVPYGRGYGVKTPNRRPGKGRHKNDANCRMIDQFGSYIDMWVESIEADFSMSGSTAQSRYYRQFFPRSFNQVSVKVTGRVPNSAEYNRLSSFVRSSQYGALVADDIARVQRKVTAAAGSFVIGRHHSDGTAITTVRLELKDKTRYQGRRNVKGHHKPWVLEGYIKSMPAGARRHDPAPQFVFDFIVAESRLSGKTGIFEDSHAAGTEIMSWMEVFHANKKRWSGGYARTPRADVPDE